MVDVDLTTQNIFKEARHKSPTDLSCIISGPEQLPWKIFIHF